MEKIEGGSQILMIILNQPSFTPRSHVHDLEIKSDEELHRLSLTQEGTGIVVEEILDPEPDPNYPDYYPSPVETNQNEQIKVPRLSSGSLQFIRPAKGRLSSPFGMRIHPVTRKKKMHNGIDIAAPIGTPILAAEAGVVTTASNLRGYGLVVYVQHNDEYETRYAHCSKFHVGVGDRVTKGQLIAEIGNTGLSTGPHLHFEIRINGKPVNPSSYV